MWETLNLKPGDEVIIQSLTFTADGFALKMSGKNSFLLVVSK